MQDNNNKQEHMNTLYSIVNQISPIPPHLWKKAQPYFELKVLNKGDYLFHMEDKIEDFYFLIAGLARYYYLTEEGKEFNKSFAEKPGHLLSSISSVTKGDGSPFSVELLSKFTTLSIKYQDLLLLGKQHPEWNDLLLRIYENLVIKKEKRESDFLLLDARARYEVFLNDYAMISKLVPNYHIASYLGISEVSLSRIRRDMKLTNVNDKNL